jgi:hypothetical protein
MLLDCIIKLKYYKSNHNKFQQIEAINYFFYHDMISCTIYLNLNEMKLKENISYIDL